MSNELLTLEESHVSAGDADGLLTPPDSSYGATKLLRRMRIEAPYSHSIVAGGLPEIS